ncbi:MAG: hypothetical protein FJ278_13310, partial [Planctomycetes bacterium]|nr:hypothetical protein [Planctomycetota bacterium]
MKGTKIGLLCFGLPIFFASEDMAAQPAGMVNDGSDRLTVINCADTPVYAAALALPAKVLYAALNLPAGTPLQAVTTAGTSVALLPGVENGEEVVRAHLSLKPGERVALKLGPAAKWGSAEQVCSAVFDAASGSASLCNGVVAFEYRAGQWNLSFDGPMADAIVERGERRILAGCRLDAWLDAERRGRLMGIAPKAIQEMGLIHVREARLIGGEARANPDGSATLKLIKGFDGFAKGITWTETYALLPGQPIVTYRTVFETRGDSTRYLAFVELGGGMRGGYGSLLRGQRRFKYEDPKAPNRILLAGNENAYTRIGWRAEKCWVGMESELGCGIGFSTTKEVTRALPGSSVWSLGNAGFFVRLVDAEQENFPYEFVPGRPLDLGLAFVAACGQVGIWNQTRQLFAAITRGKTPRLAASYAVYLGDQPLQPAEVGVFRDEKLAGTGTTRRAALEVDFQRAYRLSAKAEQATADNPVTIRARLLGAPGEPIAAMTLDRP